MESIALECAKYITENLEGESLYEISSNFIDLMVDFNAVNTNIYYPFLSTKVDFTFFSNKDGGHFIHPAYIIILEKLKTNMELKERDPKDIVILMDIFTAIFNSALHFYIILNNPGTIPELKAEIKKQVIFMLQNFI